MNHHPPPDEAFDPQQVIAHAQQALETSQRILAACGLTPQACADYLCRTEGPEAVARIRQEVADALCALQDQLQGKTSAPKFRAVSRVVAQRSSI